MVLPLVRLAASHCALRWRRAALRSLASRPRRPPPARTRARLSADLADHLAAGSQTIRVIVHGDARGSGRAGARATTCGSQVPEERRGVPGQRRSARRRCGRTRTRITCRATSGSSRRWPRSTAESIGADQVWAGADDVPAADGQGHHGGGDRLGDRHASTTRSRGACWRREDFTGGDGQDRFGHGTHVAAIIAGQAGKTAETQDYRGIAPGAYLLNLRVLGDDGSGTASDVIEAIDWTIEHRSEYNVRIINLSLGAPVLQPYRDDPLCEAVERAVRAGHRRRGGGGQLRQDGRTARR